MMSNSLFINVWSFHSCSCRDWFADGSAGPFDAPFSDFKLIVTNTSNALHSAFQLEIIFIRLKLLRTQCLANAPASSDLRHSSFDIFHSTQTLNFYSLLTVSFLFLLNNEIMASSFFCSFSTMSLFISLFFSLFSLSLSIRSLSRSPHRLPLVLDCDSFHFCSPSIFILLLI